MAVSGMIYFLLYLPYPPIQNFGEAINPIFKLSTVSKNVVTPEKSQLFKYLLFRSFEEWLYMLMQLKKSLSSDLIFFF